MRASSPRQISRASHSHLSLATSELTVHNFPRPPRPPNVLLTPPSPSCTASLPNPPETCSRSSSPMIGFFFSESVTITVNHLPTRSREQSEGLKSNKLTLDSASNPLLSDIL